MASVSMADRHRDFAISLRERLTQIIARRAASLFRRRGTGAGPNSEKRRNGNQEGPPVAVDGDELEVLFMTLSFGLCSKGRRL
jgi:hypothetical protein